jgi:hypothetical protein
MHAGLSYKQTLPPYTILLQNACMHHGSCGHGHACIGGGVDGCRERSNKGKHGPHVREYLGASGIHAAMHAKLSACSRPCRPCIAPSLANAHALL